MTPAHGDARQPAMPSGLVAVARALAVDKVSAEVVRALQAEGVEPILIKGPTIGAWIYDSEQPRSYADTDLLVAPAQQTDAGRVLSRLGFERHRYDWEERERLFHAGSWFRAADQAAVDLHLTLPGISGASPEEVWTVMSREREEWPLPGSVTVRTVSPPARALLLALHAIHHIDHGGEERPMYDLRQAVERVDLEVWRRAADLAVELRSGADVARALHALDGDGGAKLAEAIGLRSPATGQWETVGIERILAARTARERGRALRRALFPPASYLRYTLPLARRGPVGLALTYVRRPFTLAFRLPAAYHLWRATLREEAQPNSERIA